MKTKIVCTMGPACDSVEMLKEMINSGMTVARLNMAHGEPADHSERIRKVRQAASELNTFVPIMMDIKGPEVRIGKFQEEYVQLEAGSELTLTTEPDVLGTAERIGVNYPKLNEDLKAGDRILIDDGLIALDVLNVEGTEIYCKILNGGRLKPRKGVNLPGVKTSLPGVTERDVMHINYGLSENVEIIAASFVRKGDDIREIRRILAEKGAEHVQIISKIENQEGMDNLDDIIEASDGIMVARGDLGVEVPVQDVPAAQKLMIDKCNLAGKPVIVATHMLESMQVNPRPTRSEVSDVANAVLQGADCVMLSGESAAGKYPLESVRTMAAVAAKAETMIDYDVQFNSKRALHLNDITEVVSQSSVNASLVLDAAALIISTESGFTARMISKYRPKAPIIAVTQNEKTLPKMSLLYGVVPVKGQEVSSTDEMFEVATQNALESGYIKSGETVVLCAGIPIGKTGSTNVMKVQQV